MISIWENNKVDLVPYTRLYTWGPLFINQPSTKHHAVFAARSRLPAYRAITQPALTQCMSHIRASTNNIRILGLLLARMDDDGSVAGLDQEYIYIYICIL